VVVVLEDFDIVVVVEDMDEDVEGVTRIWFVLPWNVPVRCQYPANSRKRRPRTDSSRS
jgi:hypothetical protein